MKELIYKTDSIFQLLIWWKDNFGTSLDFKLPEELFAASFKMTMPKDLIGSLKERSYLVTLDYILVLFKVEAMIQ